MRVAFIGGGNMAQAILGGLYRKNHLHGVELAVGEPHRARRATLDKKFPLTKIYAENWEAVRGAEIVVLAIKPQNLTAIADELGDALREPTIISIMAGVSIQTLQTKFPSAKNIVRVMPNLPATVGKGFSVWITSGDIPAPHLAFVKRALRNIGTTYKTQNEQFLDIATAISGSGPGYVFAFMEAFYTSALELGVPADLAHKMVLNALAGSVALAKSDQSIPFGDLKRTVTSPGGTTAAALSVLEKGDFQKLIANAVKAAHQRSQLL